MGKRSVTFVKNAENFSTKALAMKVGLFALWWSALANERLTLKYLQLQPFTEMYCKLLTNRHILIQTDLYIHVLTRTDTYWHLHTLTDLYWHLQTLTDTYWRLLTPHIDIELLEMAEFAKLETTKNNKKIK